VKYSLPIGMTHNLSINAILSKALRAENTLTWSLSQSRRFLSAVMFHIMLHLAASLIKNFRRLWQGTKAQTRTVQWIPKHLQALLD
jgi:hypothetical protein